MTEYTRCHWAEDNELSKKYHDEIWGVPCRDDTKLFKYLVLEIFQSGLSWQTILNKEKNFVKAFDEFDIEKVSKFDDKKIYELLKNDSIIRHEQKIRASINNANKILEVQKQYGSFSNYIWSYTFDTPIINNWDNKFEVPTNNPLSEKICEDMKKMGFKFIGSTVIYSYLQAIGIINDHISDCDFKYKD